MAQWEVPQKGSPRGPSKLFREAQRPREAGGGNTDAPLGRVACKIPCLPPIVTTASCHNPQKSVKSQDGLGGVSRPTPRSLRQTGACGRPLNLAVAAAEKQVPRPRTPAASGPRAPLSGALSDEARPTLCLCPQKVPAVSETCSLVRWLHPGLATPLPSVLFVEGQTHRVCS